MIDLYDCDIYKNFVESIIANPEDTDTRLIFADYLEEEQGDQDWAHFIRISVSYSQSPSIEKNRQLRIILHKLSEFSFIDQRERCLMSKSDCREDCISNWERWVWLDKTQMGGRLSVTPSLMQDELIKVPSVCVSTQVNDGLLKQFFVNGFVEYVVATQKSLDVYGDGIKKQFPIKKLVATPIKYESWNWTYD